jgi:hypothetical protein
MAALYDVIGWKKREQRKEGKTEIANKETKDRSLSNKSTVNSKR